MISTPRVAQTIGGLAIAITAAGPLAAPADAQILNTLRGWAEDEPEWSGTLGATFSASGGNTEVISLAASARVQWLGARHRVRVLGGGVRSESDGTKTSESLAGHVRHNYEINRWLFTLVFGQVQENPFQRLESRWLVGGGARIDVARRETWDLFFGVAHMFERERIEGTAGSGDDHRLSSFVSWAGKISPQASVDVTAFYQPVWSRFSDNRLVANASVSVALVGSLSLNVNSAYQYDSRPPEAVDREDWSYQTGLSVAF